MPGGGVVQGDAVQADAVQGDAVQGGDPVFILCAARSGSTLVRFLLDAHPELACPPETKIGWLAQQLAAAWAVIEDAPPADAGDEAAISDPVAAGLRRSLDPMLASYLARRGKTRYCDKSLGTAQHAGLLLRIWPGARFICLYRHPMDVIGSGLEASPWGLTSYGFEPYVASPPDNNVAALARYWLDYTTAIVTAEERFPGRCLPVRYEDLVTDPERESGRMLDFIGVRPVPGIADHGLRLDHQRFGPGDYKIWNTARVTRGSVGRGWSIPARLIPAPVLDRLNDLADVLGYLQVGPHWGVGPAPADLRTEPAPTPSATPVVPPPPVTPLDARILSGLARLGEPFTRAHGSHAKESVLLFATATTTATTTTTADATAPPDASAWWLLDLAGATLTQGLGHRVADAGWSVTGSAQTWHHVLTGEANLGVAFRRGDLRYADNGGAGAGSPEADRRVAMLADLLGIAQAGPLAPPPAPAV